MILSRTYFRHRHISELLGTLGNKLRPYVEPGNLLTIVFLALCYFFVGKIGIRPATPNHSVTAIWLPAGISLAVFLLRGYRVWPGHLLGAFLLSVTIRHTILISGGLAVANTIEVLLAAFLVNKYANGINAFFRTRDFLRFFIFAVMLAPALCATLGVGFLCMGGVARLADFSAVWFVWWVGDMLGVLFVTPFLVLLLGHKHHSIGLGEPLEVTALIAGLSITCVLNFGHQPMPWIPQNGLLFLCAPFLAWSALRFCPLEAAGATLVMGGFAKWGSLHGLGPFQNAVGLPLFVGGFLAVGTAITMAVAAACAEQKNATRDALGMYCVLKDVKEGEIRVLQETVEALQVELATKATRRTGGSSHEGIPASGVPLPANSDGHVR
jgi:two-component system, NarL family, sensor histidine kinase FusK